MQTKTKDDATRLETHLVSEIGSKQVGSLKDRLRASTLPIAEFAKIPLSSGLRAQLLRACDSKICVVDNENFPAGKSLTFGKKTWFGGRQKYFIGDSSKRDIISIEGDAASPDANWQNLKIGAYTTHDLLQMDEQELSKTRRLLNTRIARDMVERRNQLDSDLNFIKPLAVSIGFLREKSRRLTSRQKKHCRPNGCTIVPDFNIKHCCNDHDICYCMGGDEARREHCDWVFFECMRNEDFPLAGIYYQGVRIFGRFRFNYH